MSLRQYACPALIAISLSLTGCAPIRDSGIANDQYTHHSTVLSTIALPDSKITQDFAAHWIDTNTLLLPSDYQNPRLLMSTAATLDEGSASHSLPLSAITMPKTLRESLPHLRDFTAYQIDVDREHARSLLKQQLAVLSGGSKEDENRTPTLSYVQTYGVLDALFTAGPDDADENHAFGAVINGNTTKFELWAPTARSVAVSLYDPQDKSRQIAEIPLVENPTTGIWSVSTDLAPQGTFYRYHLSLYHPKTQAIESLVVTDPYSLSLSTNSRFSQVVSLDSSATQPAGWGQHPIPGIDRPEQNLFYEVHIRDFSALDETLAAEQRGKYAAFTDSNSAGVAHLKALRAAGMNNIHLLPTYDLASINEDPLQTLYPDDPLNKVCQMVPQAPLCGSDLSPDTSLQAALATLDSDGDAAQANLEILRQFDAYNWGYDPFHYTVPEGSYALLPDGMSRLKEFRDMIMAIHGMGYRVIMDVVYNHTFASGLNEKSVLDKVVPNYYHRLHPITGAIEQSTCCDNTATEHRMMTKLMIDSLRVWARDYKIDGFRFDLMGHQPKAAMLEAREAVREVDPDTYFYGEGWNFGEVANNAQFIQASQLELAGTEIGTFTDRLRDAVRGGSSFLSGPDIRRSQGVGNGLKLWPNELADDLPAETVKKEYQLSMDQIRIGLAGNLAEFPLSSSDGQQRLGKDIAYGDQPAGYALDPADTINYVSKHDNQTLWDNHQYRIPHDATTEQRVRMQILSLAYPMFAQGIPFFHMGSELLRSKSFLRDSYDYGDWFNRVDFGKQTNNYAVGLPPAEKDQANWPVIRALLEGNDQRDKVSAAHIQQASARFMDLLRIRTASALFSLPDAQSIISRVSFLNTGPDAIPGVIAMHLTDNNEHTDLDKDVRDMLVIFNNGPDSVTLPYDQTAEYSLHPVLQQGADELTKQSKVDQNGFQVPGLTVAVFVR